MYVNDNLVMIMMKLMFTNAYTNVLLLILPLCVSCTGSVCFDASVGKLCTVKQVIYTECSFCGCLRSILSGYFHGCIVCDMYGVSVQAQVCMCCLIISVSNRQCLHMWMV